MAVSGFGVFEIGIGTSSVGPMRSKRLYALRLDDQALLSRAARVLVSLWGGRPGSWDQGDWANP